MQTKLMFVMWMLLSVNLCSCRERSSKELNPMPSMGNPVGKWQLMISRDIVEFKSDGTVTRSDSGQPAVEPAPFSPLKRDESARWETQGDKLTFISKDADGKTEKMTFEYSIGTRSGTDTVLNKEVEKDEWLNA
jgi:hypothetical protein